MKKQLSCALTVVALLTASACATKDREQPVLCVVSPIPAKPASDGQLTLDSVGCGDLNATSDEDTARTGCHLEIAADGQGFVLLHKLPDGLTPLGNLEVHIESPCGGADQDIEVSYADGLAVLTGVIPPGGQCAFSVSATLANSELRCDFTYVAPDTNTGATCTPVCPAP